MKIRGYDITEKRVAAVCAVVLLVVSLFAAVKQTNAAADTENLLRSKDQQKSSKSVEQKMKAKSDDSTVQQLVPQKNNANAANANKDAGAAKKATGSQEQSDKNETEKKNKPDDKAAQSSVNKSKPQSGSYTYAVQDGDSYATIVRRAISEHGGSGLNPAQKIAAETKLAEQAGWPEVDTGQTIKIDSAVLSQAVSLARSMTADEQQSWQAYADGVIW